MKVLLTGANGLLGHNVIVRLLECNHEVNAIVRDEGKLRIKDGRLHVFKGSFLDYCDLREAAKGCDAVIHAAGTTDMSPLKYSHYTNIIVEGSKNVLGVCKEENIRRIVYISTANTIGYGSAEVLADESAPMEYPFSDSYYAMAKTEAEGLFLNHAKNPATHVVIVNPTFMLGAYDTKPSSGEMFLTGYGKRLLAIPKGGKNFVHVRDVAVAAVNAMTTGVSGERYIAGNRNLGLKEFYMLQKDVCGTPAKIVTLPDFLLTAVGHFGNLLRKAGIPAVFSLTNLRQLSVREYYSCKKAIDGLAMPQTPVETAISDCYEWFVETGKIKPSKTLNLK